MHSSEQFDDDEGDGGMYENGHWEWDEKLGGLQFITKPRLLYQESWINQPRAAIIGTAEFKDDIDVLEQQRFKKRFQRRTFDGDVVTLQDIKDVVLYTAPHAILNPIVVCMLHLTGTERFLKALIFYLQYYIQISDIMGQRALAQETTVRTPASVEVEKQYKENLEDLRLLIAKEYAIVLTGGADFKTYHHMGPAKKMRSLSKRSNFIFESLIRMGIQIVWLALGRKYLNQIELEMHRLFKTSKFNMVEHKRKTNYVAKMSPQERYVLFGECIQNEKMLKTLSPLMYEISCRRDMDYRLLGLGVVNYPNLNPRLQYMQDVLIAPEYLLPRKQVSVGILGLRRSRFDTMLKEIVHTAPSTSSLGMKQSLVSSRRSMALAKNSPSSSRISIVKSTSKSCTSITTQFPDKLIADIELPWKESERVNSEDLSSQFPTKILPQIPCNLVQRQKWLIRATHLVAVRKRIERLRNKTKLGY